MAYGVKLQVFEIFDKVTNAKTRNEKIAVLQQHSENWAVKDVCRGIFDDRVQWKLPEGTPPYEPCSASAHPATLLKENRKFRFFAKGVPDCERLISPKREKLFIDILESVHPRDAELLVSMINKKNPVKGLTKKIVQEAYPGLIPE